MIRIRWTLAAAADLQNIKEYLLERYPHLAQPTVLKIRDAIRSLRTMPHRGRVGREEGTRELPMSPLPYVLVYRLKHDAVEILRIWHGARQRP